MRRVFYRNLDEKEGWYNTKGKTELLEKVKNTSYLADIQYPPKV